MALFGKKRSRQLPEGWIERGDQILVPADDAPAELVEGHHAFRTFDVWEGATGPFVGVNATAVQAAAESSDDPRGAAEEAMDDPANWIGDDPPDGIQMKICRLDISTGKLDVGPAMADMILGTAEFAVIDVEGTPCICINVQTIQEVVYQQIEARGLDVTEDEHRAITYAAMDDPAHWEGHPDDDDEPDDDERKYSFFPLDFTTGRIDRR